MAKDYTSYKSYLGYLIEWANTHDSIGYVGMSPSTYDEFIHTDYPDFARNEIFATVYWTDEDVKGAIIDLGYQATSDNVNLVIRQLKEDKLKGVMIENGWEYINYIIDEALRNKNDN